MIGIRGLTKILFRATTGRDIGRQRPDPEPIWALPPSAPQAEGTAAMLAAAAAIRAGNVAAARAQWAVARRTVGAPREAWLLDAEYALVVGDIDAANALLIEAAATWPNDSNPLHDLARLEERRGDFLAAEGYWRRFILLDDQKWWAFSALATALRAQSRMIEAAAVLADGAERLPGDRDMAAEPARIAQTAKQWRAALDGWRSVVEAFPLDWTGYHGLIETWNDAGRPDEAAAILREHGPKFRDNAEVRQDMARLAERAGDWRAAEEHWRVSVALGGRTSWAYLGLANALRKQNELGEAETFLRIGLQYFPVDHGLLTESACCAELRQDWQAAAQFWHVLWMNAPTVTAVLLREIAAWRNAGLLSRADEITLEAINKGVADPALYDAFGGNAVAAEDWHEALSRYEGAQVQFPEYGIFRERIAGIRPRIPAAEPGRDKAAQPLTAQAAPDCDDRDLVLKFESLGGRGHGCEFGIFQRSFGAEPLGLLRWADLDHTLLCTALETGFAGVGDPEFTNIFVPDPDGEGEYWTTDTRFHMAMRTFVRTSEVPLERMSQQVTKRLHYLSRKLVDDLRASTKIFVYKDMKRHLTDAELDRLHTACRRYGDNALLYIRYSDGVHPNGSVEIAARGLMIGYVDHFSHSPDTDVFIGEATEALLGICRRAFLLWDACLRAPIARAGAPSAMAAVAGPAQDGTPAPSALPEASPARRPADQMAARLAEGRSLRDSGRLAEAATVMDQIHRDFPDEDEPIVQAGWVAQIARDWERASGWWEMLRSRAPHHIVGFANGAVAAREQGLVTQAEALLKEGMTCFPNAPDLAIEYAACADVRRDWPEAERRWKHVRAHFPDEPRSYARAALALREQDRFAEAEALVDEAILRFPTNVELAVETCWLAHHARDWSEADRRWSGLRQHKPELCVGWTSGSIARRELGHFDDAGRLLQHAMAQFPGDATPFIEYAWLATAQRNWQDAIERWRDVYQRVSHNREAYLNCAIAEMESGDLASAAATLDLGLAKFPQDHTLSLKKASLLARAGQLTDAVQMLETVRRQHPDDVRSYLDQATILRDHAKYDDAEHILSEGTKRMESNWLLWRELGVLAEIRGDWSVAVKRWLNFLARFPDQKSETWRFHHALLRLSEIDPAAAEREATAFQSLTRITAD